MESTTHTPTNGEIRLGGSLVRTEDAIKSFRIFSITALLAQAFDALIAITSGLNQFVSEMSYFGILTIEVYFLWTGLRRLRRLDTVEDRRFARPTQLTFGSLFGLPVIGFASALGYSNAETSLIPSGLPAVVLPLIGILLLFGLLVSIAGLIGAILGLWRIGSRFNNISIKQGSILFYLPFIGVIGAGLLLRGFLQLDNKQPKVPRNLQHLKILLA
ncbi:MAG TPA: hypothetical protein VGR53_00070 [Nitrososphaerales archaeon]|nr:hypothetical protein [Nitrososphaerales archaeon]